MTNHIIARNVRNRLLIKKIHFNIPNWNISTFFNAHLTSIFTAKMVFGFGNRGKEKRTSKHAPRYNDHGSQPILGGQAAAKFSNEW
jgi:hypothetical protein